MSDPYLGTRTLMRRTLDSLLPDGAAWAPVPGGDLDEFLDGLGDGLQAVYDTSAAFAYVRDPSLTPFLATLEREYGVTPNTQLTDAQRSATLAAIKFKRNFPSSITTLQNALDRAGFGAGGYGLTVYANDPPVDPAPFTTFAFITMCTPIPCTAECGYYTTGPVLAVAGVSGGIWIVNGDDIFLWSPNYIGCGDPTMCCGYYPVSAIMAECGIFYTLSYTLMPITSPADPTTWPLVFFIAAGVTRQNPWFMNDIAPLALAQAFTGQSGVGQGAISALSMTQIPSNLRGTLIEIILHWKPIHCWAVLMCTFN